MKYERLEFRITKEKKDLLRLAALIEVRSLTQFVIYHAVKEAKRILSKRTKK